MKLLKEISDRDIGLDSSMENIPYIVRKAARAVLYDNNNRIAILSVAKGNYHKLPGGGIELGEDIFEALIREIREEVGAEIEVTDVVGCIIEYRNEFKQLQISYCYKAKIIGELAVPNFTEFEMNHGFELSWYSPEEAYKLIQQDQPTNYAGKFIVIRDRVFLEEALKLTV